MATLASTTEKQLPVGWRWASLADVCVFLDSRRIPINDAERSKRIEGKKLSELYPYYGANGQVGWIDDYLFDEPLILLAEDGGNFGSHDRAIAYAVSGQFWVNNHAHVLKPRECIDFDYCRYALAIRPDVGQLVSGTTRAKLNQEVAARIPIPLPPLNEQKRIAAILNEQMEAIEQMRAAAETQKEAVESLFRAFLRSILSGPDAASWPLKRLEEVATLERGKFSPRPRNDPRYFGGPYPWIQIGEVEGANKYVLEHRGTLNDLGLSVSKMFPKGTLVISIAASIGAVGILGFDSCMPDSLVGITPKQGMSDSEFLYYTFLLIRDQLQSIAPQMAQANLKLSMLNPVEIRIPSLQEQRRIVKIMNDYGAEVDRAGKTLRDQLDAINKLPSALLRSAFSGEL